MNDRVVHERAGDQLAVLVVDRTLQERLSESLGDAAVDLSLHQQGVDDLPTVIHRHIAPDLDLAGFRVHLHDTEMGTEGEGEVLRLVKGRGLQTRFLSRRKVGGNARPWTRVARGRVPKVPVELVVLDQDRPLDREDGTRAEYLASIRSLETHMSKRRRGQQGQGAEQRTNSSCRVEL